MSTLYTVGHSNRSIEEFIETLRGVPVTRVVDVRKLRGSNRYPQFNADALADSLRAAHIELVASPPLTGRRPVSHEIDPTVNGWWENRSFHNYADHALSAEFAEALRALLHAAAVGTSAVMCSEAVWWRCHRRIIADHLIAHGAQVRHLLGPGREQVATLSEGAVVGADGVLTYPSKRPPA